MFSAVRRGWNWIKRKTYLQPESNEPKEHLPQSSSETIRTDKSTTDQGNTQIKSCPEIQSFHSNATKDAQVVKDNTPLPPVKVQQQTSSYTPSNAGTTPSNAGTITLVDIQMGFEESNEPKEHLPQSSSETIRTGQSTTDQGTIQSKSCPETQSFQSNATKDAQVVEANAPLPPVIVQQQTSSYTPSDAGTIKPVDIQKTNEPEDNLPQSTSITNRAGQSTADNSKSKSHLGGNATKDEQALLTPVKPQQQTSTYPSSDAGMMTSMGNVQEGITPDSRPGKPITSELKSDSLFLQWSPPQTLSSSSYYKIRFKDKDSKWKYYPEDPTVACLSVKGLKSDSTYIFQVRTENDDDEGPFGPPSDAVTTRSSPANCLKTSSVIVKKGTPSTYKIKINENAAARNTAAKTRKLEFGTIPNKIVSEKTIMFVGGTGVGKSTMVDAIFNYVYAVNWDDPYRFTLVDLEEEEIDRKQNEAMSQTEWITRYTLYPEQASRVDYKLHIIDTPGFGDPRGLQRDEEIVAQIRDLFSAKGEQGILLIDAVCFLVKASDARLTASLKYIFNSMVSIFGKDIESNVCTFVTFADGDNPKVLSAMKEAKMPQGRWYPFNNSCVFESNGGSGVPNMYSMSWDMGYKSCEVFFSFLEKATTKSLQLTQQVLKERQLLDITVHNVQKKVNAGLDKMNAFKKEMAIIEQHKLEIDSNKDFEYEVEESKIVMTDLQKGIHVTNCTHCHITCHYNCAIPRDEDKRGCVAMGPNGYCTQCDGKCFWEKHVNNPYVFSYVKEKIKKTYNEKLKKYQKAGANMLPHEEVAKRMKAELDELEASIEAMMKTVNDCNNTLQKIALSPNQLSIVEHIDYMIANEKHEKNDGFLERIEILIEYRQRAEIHKDVKRLKDELDLI